MEFFIILLLLLVNGVFAMYEIALVSSSRARLETKAEAGSKKAQKVIGLLDEPEKMLSTIQVGITLIGIVSGAFGGVAIAGDVAPLFEKVPMLKPYAPQLAMITVVGIITYLSLVIRELVPKSLALNNPEKIAVAFTPMMIFLTKIVYPFVWLLSVSTRFFNRLLGVKTGEERPMTEEELKFIIRQSSEQGVLEKEETEMIRDVFRFTDKTAGELMTPRRDVVCLSTKQTLPEVLETIRENHFSKYPLFDSSIDEVIGLVSVKEIILLTAKDQKFDLKSISQEPLFLSENIKANRILELFKKNKCNFGIVVNEYGSVEGIITLHDLTESVFGDILEEYEQPQQEIVPRADGSLLVDGMMNLGDFMEAMGISHYEDVDGQGFTTLSGLATYILQRIPRESENFTYGNLRFEVVDMDGSRVDKLLVNKLA